MKTISLSLGCSWVSHLLPPQEAWKLHLHIEFLCTKENKKNTISSRDIFLSLKKACAHDGTKFPILTEIVLKFVKHIHDEEISNKRQYEP